MPPIVTHLVLDAHRHRVPRPFIRFAVRSDEAAHAWMARTPYGRVHRLQTRFLDAVSTAGIVQAGRAMLPGSGFSDIRHALTTWPQLAQAAPAWPDLAGHIAAALRLTGVLGDGLPPYQHSLAGRIDYLATCGAGFHNDVTGHWSRCLFWALTLEATQVEFVLPHAGLRMGLAPGDLLVFDQTMAHGLCRPADQGQVVAASFESGAHSQQLFLTGELLLSDAHWAALGHPWLAVDAPGHRGALDLMVAEFDERSGAVKRPAALRDGMKLSTCHADLADGVQT